MGSAVLAGLIALPSAALALPPCVGADVATPLPNATEVALTTMDIPAARFPGRWQQGQFKGFAYRVFPDLTAIVFDARANTGWRIDLLCTEALRCVSTDVGAVPEAARAAAKAIGDCLMPEEKPTPAPLAPVAAPSPAPKAAPAPPAVKQAAKAAPDTKTAVVMPAEQPSTPPTTPQPAAGKPATPADPAAAPKAAVRADRRGLPTTAISRGVAAKTASVIPSAPAPKPSQPSNAFAAAPMGPKTARICPAPSAQDAGSTIRAIQRLLISVGKDPGPIDGSKGKRTVIALEATVGAKIAKLDPVSVLIALTAMICSGELGNPPRK